MEEFFYELKWLCWQDLWHGADAYYGRKANNKKADEGMITFSEAFWRGDTKGDI